VTVALRIADSIGVSDVGRQREANEDSLVEADPLFAVADGMGGAQAGEVASGIAVDVLGAGDEGAGTPEERLTRMVVEANRRIYELSRQDEARRGMGTTLTAAILDDDCLSLAHVGDSRAYRLRDGVLEQLTHDHSLVAELERSGQLSPEDAEHHPQRSIITRALGPEPDVEVDSHTHRARAGDVYLLCSDGLTGMISDDEIASILRAAPSLADGGRELVRAANQSGGKDNITVVLFRLEEGGPERSPAEEQETIHQGLSASDVQSAVADQERAAVAAPSTPRPATTPRHPAATRPAPRRSPARTRRRRARGVLVGLLITALVVGGAVLGARQVWFVGTDEAGLVTLYRGLPYELPFGLELYSERYASSVPARTIAEARRERLLDHEWRSREDAEDLVRQLERGTLDVGDPGR
jgi:PPM family protein phosphatase